MNKSLEEAKSFVEGLVPKLEESDVVLLAVPFTLIKPSVDASAGSVLKIGAQNMNDASKGAFTGEVAALMLKEVGASFVLLGHSERRKYFGESNEFIHKKLLRAFKDRIDPILCIGETLDEREKGHTEGVLDSQLAEALEGVKNLRKLKIAYEPVWAIGTGETATPDIAQEAHHFIRQWLNGKYGEEVSSKLLLLYGGSVTEETCKTLLGEEDIDGLLIGGASLSLDSFVKIVHDSRYAKRDVS